MLCFTGSLPSNMKPKGEEVAEAIRDWLREEIKKGPSYVYDLGRFFFTVSSTTVGLEIAVEKLTVPGSLHWALALSIAALFFSVLVALRMAIPFTHALDGAVNLYDLYSTHVKRLVQLSVLWFALWILGVVLWLWNLFWLSL
jgi:hypothetical protein